MEVDELKSGNTTHCQQKQIFRQALHEMHKKERLHDNIVIEIDLLREAWKASLPGSRGISGFVHGVGMYPFYTIMYTEAQVEAYVLAYKDNDSVMHFDSTGSVVREVVGQKRPYYYCFFIGAKKMPALEFITTRHNATWICSMLEVFGEDAKMLNGRRAVRPRHVVTDFSFALIYAVLNAFNKQTLVEYLSFAYKVLGRRCNTSMIMTRTFIALCTAHFSKMIASRLIRSVSDKNIRRVAMVMLTLLMRTVDLNEAVLLYNKLHILLCTELNTKRVKQTFCDVIKHIKQTVPDEDDVAIVVDMENTDNKGPSDTMEDLFEHETTVTIKEQSPFTQHFADALDDVDEQEDGLDTDVMNNLYSPAVFKVITDVIHLYPLWAAALRSEVTRFASDSTDEQSNQQNTQCRSNAIVESHFKSVKHGKKISGKLRPRVFLIDRLRAVLAKVNEAAIKFPKTRKKRRSARCDDPASTPEVWNRTRKRRRYCDKDVSLRILKDMHPAAVTTSKEIKRKSTSDKSSKTYMKSTDLSSNCSMAPIRSFRGLLRSKGKCFTTSKKAVAANMSRKMCTAFLPTTCKKFTNIQKAPPPKHRPRKSSNSRSGVVNLNNATLQMPTAKPVQDTNNRMFCKNLMAELNSGPGPLLASTPTLESHSPNDDMSFKVVHDKQRKIFEAGVLRKSTKVIDLPIFESSSQGTTIKSSSSSSGIVTFKNPQLLLSTNKHISKGANMIPLRDSSPRVTSHIPKEFDDLGIQLVQDHLRNHHPDVAGLQFVGLGMFKKNQLPKFECVVGVRFVQILNVGDHWVCVTNMFGASTHDLYVFDSLQMKRLPESAVIQISAILRNDNTDEMLTVHVRKFVRQTSWSRACGLYASAAAFACCNGEYPTGLFYETETMRDAIEQRVLLNSAGSIPGIPCWPVHDVAVYKISKVYCTCHKPWRSRNDMIQCSNCLHWFHVKCVGNVPSAAMQITMVPWTGPCCRTSRRLRLQPCAQIVIE